MGADCLCHMDCVIACSVIVVISFLLAGQGCSPDASRAAQIFTDLALKGHPYAQVGERGWALISKQWVGLDAPASGEGKREVGPDTQLVVLIPIFEFELLSLSLSPVCPGRHVLCRHWSGAELQESLQFVLCESLCVSCCLGTLVCTLLIKSSPTHCRSVPKTLYHKHTIYWVRGH